MVPDAHFTSYYGRPVVKAAPWTPDVPAYLFLGGLAGGSSLLGAGADLTDRPVLRRGSRVAALAAVTASFAALVHDLGRPSRFHHMLRVAKRTSPMSVGTWLLTVYGPMAGIAAVSEGRGLLPRQLQDGPVGRLLPTAGRGAGLVAAAVGPAVASYTAVLLSNTATPAWYDARVELPYVFVGSAAAAAGGLGLLTAGAGEAGPARRMAVGGAIVELAAHRRMQASMGLSAETLHAGLAGRWSKGSTGLTVVGAALAAVGGRSRASRVLSGLGGLALLAGSVCTRFSIFEAGQASARDPRYTVVPQRERLEQRRARA